MKKQLRASISILCLMLGFCTIILLTMPSVASADITPGTPINWCSGPCGLGDQGTLTGFFELDSTTGAINNWNLTTTDGSVTGSNYLPGNQNALLPASIIGGTEYVFSDQFNSGLSLGNTPLFNGGLLTITVNCEGVSNCLAQASAGQFFTITGGTETFTTWFCSSGGTSCSPSVAAPRILDVSSGAFINVTDPVGGLALNLDTTASGTAWTPGSGNPGGGGNTGVPEPSTLLLSALGLGGLALKRFYS
jgi:hypothetical protein